MRSVRPGIARSRVGIASFLESNHMVDKDGHFPTSSPVTPTIKTGLAVSAILHSPLALFMIQAALIIALSRLVGVVVSAIGQPMVIAEIVAGILLGPSLLGLASPHLMGALFPKESLPMLSLVSQVGLVLFMFLI